MRLVRSGVGGGGMIDASTSGAIDTSASVAMRSLFALSLSLSLLFSRDGNHLKVKWKLKFISG